MFSEMFAMFRTIQPRMTAKIEAAIRKRCIVMHHPKKSILLDYGQICHYCLFAAKGLVHGVFQHKEREETCWFMGEYDVIISVESFYKQKPSEERLVALEDTIGIALHYKDLQWIYDHHPAFERVGRILTEEYYLELTKDHKWKNFTAEEKYEKLFNAYPKYINRVPIGALASYMGVAKGTLSRIRTAFLKRKGKGDGKNDCD